MAKEKILVVEDEANIGNFIRTILVANGYEVVSAQNAAAAMTMIHSHCPDLLVLDLGLPDMDGMDVIAAVRKWTLLPIIVVSARMRERDKVLALDAGADDYVTKPFGTSEFLARIRTALRHAKSRTQSEHITQTGVFAVGELTIDYDKRQVFVDGKWNKIRRSQNIFLRKLVLVIVWQMKMPQNCSI